MTTWRRIRGRQGGKDWSVFMQPLCRNFPTYHDKQKPRPRPGQIGPLVREKAAVLPGQWYSYPPAHQPVEEHRHHRLQGRGP